MLLKLIDGTTIKFAGNKKLSDAAKITELV
jgi:hypothetical protein